jgi:hypothetical protein
MGLGPPVCTKCKVLGELTVKSDILLYGAAGKYGISYWHCPICKSLDLHGNLWEYDKITQDEIDGNTRFLKFMNGIE